MSQTTTTVPDNFGSGGSGLSPNASAGIPSLCDILQDHEAAINANDTAHALDNSAPVALGDADATITVAQGRFRQVTVPLTGNRTVTLSTAGAQEDDRIDICRANATGADTMAIVDGGAGTPTLVTFPASKTASCTVQFNGGHWTLRRIGVGP